MPARLALLACLLLLVSGCAAPAEPDEATRSAGREGPPGLDAADEDDPSSSAALLAAAQTAGAAIEVIPLSFDGLLLPGICVSNPVTGCAGTFGSNHTFVDRAGVDRWLVDLTITWTPSSSLMQTLDARAYAYYSCGWECRAADNGYERVSASPLVLQAALVELPEDPRGFWLIIDATGTIPLVGQASTQQEFHVKGTLTAISDP
jgi:hypothetical protein